MVDLPSSEQLLLQGTHNLIAGSAKSRVSSNLQTN
jgi:hypothetical protein